MNNGKLIQPVILSGGSGTRLWPLSVPENPKQFISLFSKHSLLQETALRLSDSSLFAPPIVICLKGQEKKVEQAFEDIRLPLRKIVLEPLPRNTGPAAVVAALLALRENDGKDRPFLLLPSDHLISKPEKLLAAVKSGVSETKRGSIVIFGIAPDSPKTGYGYIQRGSPKAENIFNVKRFVEKPTFTLAKKYQESGDYSWNSGLLMAGAEAFLREFEQYDKASVEACSRSLETSTESGNVIRLNADFFTAATALSVDYAVLEKTDKACVIPIEGMGWNDVGSWEAVWEILPKDSDGNVTLGEALLQNVKNSLIYSKIDHLIAVSNLEDMVVIATDKVFMIIPKKDSQSVKSFVEQLKASEKKEKL